MTNLKEEMERILTKQKEKEKFMKNTKVLDEMLCHQRSPYDKAGIDYVNKIVSTPLHHTTEERN